MRGGIDALRCSFFFITRELGKGRNKRKEFLSLTPYRAFTFKYVNKFNTCNSQHWSGSVNSSYIKFVRGGAFLSWMAQRFAPTSHNQRQRQPSMGGALVWLCEPYRPWPSRSFCWMNSNAIDPCNNWSIYFICLACKNTVINTDDNSSPWGVSDIILWSMICFRQIIIDRLFYLDHKVIGNGWTEIAGADIDRVRHCVFAYRAESD